MFEETLKRALRAVFGGGADINAGNPLQVYDPKVAELVGLTTYDQRTAVATDAEGTDWVDLLDTGALTKPEEIWGYILTVAGGWAGLCQMRIVDGDGNKIYPFADYEEENTDFVSGIVHMFPAPIVVPKDTGYVVQFRSTNPADAAGKTCALTELDVIVRG